jgi:hypothetical protein
MAEWQPFPPLTLMTVSSCLCLMAVFNLHALLPFRRPSSFTAVGSLLTAPSGSVPDDSEGDCADAWLCGEEGCILDCFI